MSICIKRVTHYLLSISFLLILMPAVSTADDRCKENGFDESIETVAVCIDKDGSDRFVIKKNNDHDFLCAINTAANGTSEEEIFYAYGKFKSYKNYRVYEMVRGDGSGLYLKIIVSRNGEESYRTKNSDGVRIYEDRWWKQDVLCEEKYKEK